MNAPRKQNSAAAPKAAKNPRGPRAPRKAGKRKQVASPISTGGRGFSFENRVQAVHLIAMCLGIGAHGVPLGNTVTKLTFQGRVHGHNTDDLIVDFVSPQGALGTLRLQLKRSITARKADDVFVEAVGLAWLDFRDASFRRGRDVLMIAYLPASVAAMAEVAEVTRQAVGTSHPVDWKMKIFAENFSNQKRREAFTALEAAAENYNNGEQVDLSDLHQFAIHLKFQHFDLDSDLTADVSAQQLLLTVAVPQGKATDHWLRFVSSCSELNDIAGDVDLESAVRHIGEELDSELRVWRTLRSGRQSASSSTAQPLPGPPELPSLGNTSAVTVVSAIPASTFAETAPAARSSSLDKMVSRILDDVSRLHKELRYQEASERLESLGEDFESFDTYQKALWHLLRGMCRWHLGDDSRSAAEDFLRAAELNDDGPKFAAARIRGHLMLQQVEDALKAGAEAELRFPSAYEVWVAYGNARVVRGDVLRETDIPPEFRELAIAWQLVAGSQERAGNLVTAFELARIGVSKADATFFNREAMLRYALQDATQNKVNVGFRVLPPDQTARLRASVEAFVPRQETLWSAAQSPRALEAAVVHLGYAYILIGEPQRSLELMAEARSRGVDMAGADMRIELDAHRDLGASATVLGDASGRLKEMSSEALVSFAQTALDLKDEPQLLAAEAEATGRASWPDGARLAEALRNMRWELLLRTERGEKVRSEVQAAGIDESSSSIIDLMFAIRASKGRGKKEQPRKWLDRIIELAKAEDDPGQLHVAAQLLYRNNRHAEAAAVYTRILVPQTCSRLHEDLLDCYLRMGHLAKARELLSGLPVGWEQESHLRSLALNLTQMTRDWPWVNSLAKVELAQSPDECASWLLSILAAAQCEQQEVARLVADAPLTLNGSLQHLGRLASIELQHGQGEKALLRLYEMRRKRLGDSEAAALHLTSILLTGADLKSIDQAPDVVGPGTCVMVQTEDGTTRHWTIDPSGIENLPPTEEFLSADSLEAKQLLGKKAGDELAFKDLFGEVKRSKIMQLMSAHRRLIDLSHHFIRTPLASTKYLSSMQMEHDEDGRLDLDTIRQQLERRSQFANQTLDLYTRHPAPFGIIAKQLGTDTIDLIRGWPQNGPKLEMVQDWSRSLGRAHELLSTEQRWVVDLSMLTELVTLGQQELLAFLPEVYIAAAARDVVTAKLESSAVYRKSGTMFTHDGQLGFRENTEAEWQRDRDFLLAMKKCIDTHCEVRPAYGPVDVESNLISMRRILSDDEYATVLLSLELKASILSLDDRFRRICAMLGRGGAWPQPFFNEMLVKDHMSAEDHMLVALKLLLGRRSFVSIDHFDLIRLLAMEDDFVQLGLNTLRDYFAELPLDFRSGERLLFNLLAILKFRNLCSFDLVLSLLDHLAEGLLRHPLRPEGWFAAAVFQGWLFLNLQSAADQAKVVEVLTQAEARASRTARTFTVDLKGLRREQLPFGNVQSPSLPADEMNDQALRPEVNVPESKQDATGTEGSVQDVETPNV